MAELTDREAPVFENIEKTYVENVLPHMRNFIKVKLNTIELEKINEVVRAHLNVKDNFKVNDRFEGKAYQLKVTKSLMAIIAIEKNYKLKLIDWDKLMVTKKYDMKQITIDKEIYTIAPFVFGTMPILDNSLYSTIFVLVQPQVRACYICGVANSDILQLNKKSSKSHGDSESRMKFLLFNQLKQLDFLT